MPLRNNLLAASAAMILGGCTTAPPMETVDHVEENISRADVAQSRHIGTDAETGKPVSVRMGPYGPFVQIGDKDDDEKPRFASLRPGQKMVVGDILDPEALADAANGADLVYHLAGLADLNDALNRPQESARLNILGTVNALEAARLGGAAGGVDVKDSHLLITEIG